MHIYIQIPDLSILALPIHGTVVSLSHTQRLYLETRFINSDYDGVGHHLLTHISNPIL